MGKALSVAWVYILGVIIVGSGFYLFFTMRESNITYFISSFWVMLLGLLVSGVGAARGRKILRSAPAQKRLTLDIKEKPKPLPPKESAKEEKPKPTPQKPIEPAPPKIAPKKEEKPEEKDKKPETPAQAEEIPEKDLLEIPYEKPKTQEDYEIIVCKHCGTANNAEHEFCHECGEKLRPKKGKSKKRKK